MAGTATDDDLPDVPMSDALKQPSADRLKDADEEGDKVAVSRQCLPNG